MDQVLRDVTLDIEAADGADPAAAAAAATAAAGPKGGGGGGGGAAEGAGYGRALPAVVAERTGINRACVYLVCIIANTHTHFEKNCSGRPADVRVRVGERTQKEDENISQLSVF